MAALTFPASEDGLRVTVLVGLKGETIAELHVKGLSIPPPIKCRGLVDCGSTATSVMPWLGRQLALGTGISATAQTAGGMVDTTVHRVSLSIVDPNTGGPGFTIPTLVVSELPEDFSAADVLIGLNALLKCNFLLEGPARRFSFLV